MLLNRVLVGLILRIPQVDSVGRSPLLDSVSDEVLLLLNKGLLDFTIKQFQFNMLDFKV